MTQDLTQQTPEEFFTSARWTKESRRPAWESPDKMWAAINVTHADYNEPKGKWVAEERPRTSPPRTVKVGSWEDVRNYLKLHARE